MVRTSEGDLPAGYVINAAGLYADTIARDFGFSADYRILPFKGVYVYGEDGEKLNTHVYPVPDLRHPFLGVHFTVRADGKVKIGPSAIPAFCREHYGGLRNFRPGECFDILRREAGLFARNDFGFHRDRRWGEPGIRAQLLNTKERKLEMDFRFEGDDRSFHVLNAVSPAFTCAGPFGRYLVDRVGELVR